MNQNIKLKAEKGINQDRMYIISSPCGCTEKREKYFSIQWGFGYKYVCDNVPKPCKILLDNCFENIVFSPRFATGLNLNHNATNLQSELWDGSLENFSFARKILMYILWRPSLLYGHT